MALGPDERRKARAIMLSRGVTYREALAIMSKAAAAKRSVARRRRLAAVERRKSLSERRLEPPPANLWYNRD